MELARYALERGPLFSPQYLQHAIHLYNYAVSNFGAVRVVSKNDSLLLMGEQDGDHKPWGGACSKLAAVSAALWNATGNATYANVAVGVLNWMTYYVDTDGCPASLQDRSPASRGGWQQDAHEDKVHSIVWALLHLQSLIVN
jgi:hypothetical protein